MASAGAQIRYKLKKAGKYSLIFDAQHGKNRLSNHAVIVKFKNQVSKSHLDKFALKNNLTFGRKIAPKTFVFHTYDSENLVEVLNTDDSTSAEQQVASFDLDEMKKISSETLKSKKTKIKKTASQTQLFSSQWYLKNNGINGFKSGADIHVETAWNYTKGAGVRVAVIDTGFDLAHPDINYAEESYNVIDNDAQASAPLYSREDHATAVAGIIAAKDDDSGTVGVAPESQVLPIRLIDDEGMVSVSQIVAAHYKALELGAKIINNSWGSYDSSLPSGELLELSDLENSLYDDIADRGVVVIFSSGNSGEGNFNAHPEVRHPANFAVGAVDSSDKRSYYSVYDSKLDIVAPGGDSTHPIFSTDRRDLRYGNRTYILGFSYGNYTDSFIGTSAAAPIVSGVAALVWSANPKLTGEEVKNILRKSARHDLNGTYIFDANCKNPELGYGIVDAGRAVEMALGYNQH